MIITHIPQTVILAQSLRCHNTKSVGQKIQH